MKNLVLLVIGTFLVTMTSCTGGTNVGPSNQQKAEILESKTWVLSTDEILDDLIKTGANSTQLNLVEPTMKRLQFATFKFSNGNKMELNLNDGSAITYGTYRFMPDGQTLEISFGNRKALPHKIISFSADKIVLGDDVDLGLMYKKILVPFNEAATKGDAKKAPTKKEKK